jgi:hypothetical protein
VIVFSSEKFNLSRINAPNLVRENAHDFLAADSQASTFGHGNGFY